MLESLASLRARSLWAVPLDRALAFSKTSIWSADAISASHVLAGRWSRKSGTRGAAFFFARPCATFRTCASRAASSARWCFHSSSLTGASTGGKLVAAAGVRRMVDMLSDTRRRARCPRPLPARRVATSESSSAAVSLQCKRRPTAAVHYKVRKPPLKEPKQARRPAQAGAVLP